MHTDSFFQQGVTHDVCEDYASHGPYHAVVSDGCSNGGGPRLHTDWGARILCKSVEAVYPMLRLDGDPGFNQSVFFGQVGEKAREFFDIGWPDLSPGCLTATLALAYQCGDVVRTLLMGDGVVGARRRDGTWLVKVHEAASGACFYLKYLMYREPAKYFEQFGAAYRTTTYDGPLRDEAATRTMVEFELDRTRPWFADTFPADEFDFVFVGSDGLTSFYHAVNTGTSKHNEPVSVLNVLEVLFDGLKPRGGYLQLQRNWAFKRRSPGTFQQRDWHSADDCSVAGLHL